MKMLKWIILNIITTIVVLATPTLLIIGGLE